MVQAFNEGFNYNYITKNIPVIYFIMKKKSTNWKVRILKYYVYKYVNLRKVGYKKRSMETGLASVILNKDSGELWYYISKKL